VVVSPQGLEGIEAEPGRDLIEASTAEQWTDAVCQLFNSPKQGGELGQSGRRFVEAEYRWSTQLERLREIPVLANCLTASCLPRYRQEHAHA
jgi:hypothetical protein